jgi:hypothetical protein
MTSVLPILILSVPHQLAKAWRSTSPELAGCNNSHNEVQEQGKSWPQRVKSAVLDEASR